MNKFVKVVDNIKKYFHSVKMEFKRVTWPSKQELKASTVIVLVTLATITAYLWVCDNLFTQIFSRLR